MKNIVIAGNCTKDAELRTTQSGSKVAGFSIAVNDYENGQKTTTYFEVSLFGKRGESVMQFAKKGAKICVTGKLTTREYNGKTYLGVNASDFTPMGGGQESGTQDQYGGGYDQSPSGYGAGGRGGGRPSDNFDLDDAVPFAAEWRV